MKTFYKVNVRTVKDDSGFHVTMYGIDAVSEDNIVQNSIIDAFDSMEKAEKISELCTKLKLAPEHLQDVIEDTM